MIKAASSVDVGSIHPQESSPPIRGSAGSLQSQLSPAEAARAQRVVQQHWAFVARFLQHLGVRSDLDDALQQVFMVFLDKLDRVEDGRERSFLAGCAVNIAARHKRKLGRDRTEEVSADFAAPGATPEQQAHHQRQLARMQRILDGMAEELREVFLLYEVEDMTMAEIAEALEIPAGTVASRLRRAREAFKKAVKT